MRITDTWEGEFSLLSQAQHPDLSKEKPDTKVRAVLKGRGNKPRIIDTTADEYNAVVDSSNPPLSTWKKLP